MYVNLCKQYVVTWLSNDSYKFIIFVKALAALQYIFKVVNKQDNYFNALQCSVYTYASSAQMCQIFSMKCNDCNFFLFESK